jgi:DNA-binding SARP family transcriptional activator
VGDAERCGVVSSRFLLQSFGGLALSATDGGEPVLVNQRKRLAFIAALAADANGGAARERLFALFWPESDGERARNALNQLVFAVRRDLGDDALLTDTGSIRLNPAVVDSDLRAFRVALADGRFGDAIEAYRGPFLDGVFLRDTPEFERWSDELRRALAVEYARALSREIEAARSANPARSADAMRYARLLAAHDPLSTHAALLLMRALECSGDTAAALRHATLHAAHVRAEVGSDAGPELEREVARLRAGATPLTTPSQAAPSSPLTAHGVAPETGRVQRAGNETRRRLLWGAVGGVVVAATLALVIFGARNWRVSQSDGASEALDPARVLVAAFTNRTGDSTLDYVGYMTADWITQGLSKSDLVKVVYGPTAYELSRSAPGGTAATDGDRVRLLSARSGAGTVIGGSYYLVHDSIVISASVTEGRTARVLRTVPLIAAPKSDPMRAAQALRERSVGLLATLVDPKLASLSGLSSAPPLIDAYRGYLEGLELFRQGRIPKVSLQQFLVAARRDSSFMLPVIWAVWMAGYAGQPRLRDSLLQVLEAHRAQLAPIDRYSLDFEKIARDSSVLPMQRYAAVHRIVELAPASNWSWIEAGCLYSAGSAKQALILLNRIDPEHGWAGAWNPYWVLLSNVQHSLGEYDAQRRTAERAKALGARMGADRGYAAAVQSLIGLGRVDSAMAMVRGSLAKDGNDDRPSTLAFAATEFLAHGNRTLGDSLSRAALDSFRVRSTRADSGLAVWIFRLGYVDYALKLGSVQDVKAAAEAMLSDRRGMEEDHDEFMLWAHGALGVVAAYRGDRAGALAEIQQMPDLPRLTRQMRWSSGVVKAVVAGALHDRSLALQYLGEMESQGAQGLPDAAMIATHYAELRWLANDPRIRLPYVGGAP